VVSHVSVSARHDLDAGALLPRDQRGQLSVLLALDAETAHLPAVQHTAWMTLNELARLKGVIREIGLICPDDFPLAGRIVPLAPGARTLADALLQGCAEIEIVPVRRAEGSRQGFDRVLEVGPGEPTADMRVHGEGWWGGFVAGAIDLRSPTNTNPIGPYVAASLAVGELFCSVALRDYERTSGLFYSCWTLKPSEAPPVEDGPAIPTLELDVLVAGIGAVGSMVVHALWPLDMVRGQVVLCDSDKEGVDDTNLNRYVLFGRSAVGKQKASSAAEIARDAGVTFEPVDRPVEIVERFPQRVVSAVDTNVARAAIQVRYPGRILSAATRDLRAELLRVAEPRKGACLRCRNPPEQRPDDDALRTAVADGEYGAVAELAAANELSVEEVKEWVANGGCGRASERLLPFLRSELQLPPQFAISFVSSLAGVMAAAELLKDVFAIDAPLDDGQVRAVFQFASPLARTNRPGPYAPEPICPVCGSEANEIALDAWRSRASALTPRRPAAKPDLG
jgi:hypothetical protein